MSSKTIRLEIFDDSGGAGLQLFLYPVLLELGDPDYGFSDMKEFIRLDFFDGTIGDRYHITPENARELIVRLAELANEIQTKEDNHANPD